MHAESEGLKKLLILSALDPSGGAGMSADVKTSHSLGVYSCPVITALTYQNTCEVRGAFVFNREVVEKQLNAVVDDVKIDFAKAGAFMRCCYAKLLWEKDIPFVYDPVIAATVGFKFSEAEECAKIAKFCDVLTPNVSEAEAICRALNLKYESVEEMCEKIHEELGCRVVVTGKTDVVYDGKKFKKISSVHTGFEVHGTGCVYSTALACYLISFELFEAAKLARAFVSKSATKPLRVGKCLPVVNC